MSIDSVSNINNLKDISNYFIDSSDAAKQQAQIDKANSFSEALKNAVDKNSAVQTSSSGDKPNDAALKKQCQDFESLFISMMFKNMRATVDKTDIFGDDSGSDSMAMDTFQGMLDDEYSKAMSQRGVGLAEVMYKQLSKK